MTTRLLAAALLVLASAAHADEPDFTDETRVGLSEAEFTRANTELSGKGMRLVDITVTESNGKPVIGAIWHRYKGMPAGSADRTKQQLARVFLKLDEAGLRAKSDELAKENSRVEVIDAYRAGGKNWFAASFTLPKESPVQTVGAFLTSDEVGEMRDRATQHDYDFARADAYSVGDAEKFLPVFVPRGDAEIDFGVYDRTLAILADGVVKYAGGYQPMSISIYEIKGEKRWFVLWDKADMTREFLLTDTADQVRQRIASGGHIIDLDSEAGYDGKVYYYAVAIGGKSDD